jgi:hypothetical protein
MQDGGDDGGKKGRKSIVTNDPNAVKAYQDSLNLYNLDEAWVKSQSESAYNTWKVRANHMSSNQQQYNDLVFPKLEKAIQAGKEQNSYNRISNVTNIPREPKKYLSSTEGDRKIGDANNGSDKLFEVNYKGYKKPVQPLVYEPHTSEPQHSIVNISKKGLPQIPNPTMSPQDMEFYKMQGNVPVYGHNNSLIGMMNKNDFYPDYMNTANRTSVNQQDSDLIQNSEMLKSYLLEKGFKGNIKQLKYGGKYKINKNGNRN